VKLRKLDAYITARRSVADYYDKAFAHNNKITTPFRAAYGTHVFHQYTMLLEGVDRDGLNQYLADKQIPSMIYYPVPAHRQQMFAAFGGANYKLATTDWLTQRVISLPIHTEMETDQLEYITKNVLDYIN
jgi:UDP-2-acetamido-2-deoxy-ribo-hexuluronate aminotransferase